MAGTALTVIPWAYQQSGLILGIALTIVAFAFSFYTCYLVIMTAGNDIDYTETLRKHFGKAGWLVGMICFIFNFAVPILIFFQLLSSNFYPILLCIIGLIQGKDYETVSLKPDWSEFSYTWTCVIILVITFLMTAPREVKIYNKINSFGVVFIVIIIIFQLGVGIYSITNTDYIYSKSEYEDYLAEKKVDPDTPYVGYISMVSGQFAPLMGILGGGFYFHNISLSVIRNARHPENNLRNVFLGYVATCLTYIMCGTLGYYGFIGSKFEEKIDADPDHLII